MKRHIWWLSVGLLISLVIGCVAVSQNSLTTKVARELYLPPHQDFRLVVISDLNSQYGSTEYDPEVIQAIALMDYWQPDLVLCGGDMIAGQKASLTESQIKSMWAAFDRQITAPLRKSKIPFGFTIGNHDGSGAIKNQTLVFQSERELAQAYWQQHQLGLDFIDRGNFPFYYSFQQNDIFFLVWDASTSNISQQQLTWVQQSLSSAAAQQAKTRVVIGHLPLYPVATAKNKPGEYLKDGDKLRSLLNQSHVDLYVSGHHHAYYPGKIDNLKMLHAGALGQGARQLINSELPPKKTITVVDLELATSKITYTTYDAVTWSSIEFHQLPAFIPYDHGRILRHDL
jgi:predicted MPP superfamily phosphohydrolase